MTHDPSELLTDQLRENLPDVIRRVVEDYSIFAAQHCPMEAKDFDRHHKAGKAAVAHLLAISKLAATLKTDTNTKTSELDDILREARHLLAGNHDGTEGDEDEAEDQL